MGKTKKPSLFPKTSPMFDKRRVEIVGNGRLTAFGVQKILSYSETEIILDMVVSSLTVKGKALFIRGFGRGCARIEGRIGTVHFGEEEA